MSELYRVAKACEQALQQGGGGVLATVVRVQGSAYRRPGARMFFPARGAPTGIVSGGCLEGDLAERASHLPPGAPAERVVYDMRSPEDIVWGLGLGCDGEVQVLLERVEPQAKLGWLDWLAQMERRRASGALAVCFDPGAGSAEAPGSWTAFEAQDERRLPGSSGSTSPELDAALEQVAERGRVAVIQAGDDRWMVQPVLPPTRLWLFGAGLDAPPVLQIADALGWESGVFDHRPAFATPERFPRSSQVRCVDWSTWSPSAQDFDGATAALIMTHHFLHDQSVLAALARTKLAYLGLLGPKRRGEKLISALEESSPEWQQLRPKVFSPVGLDIGSETPEEIALSAIAEIQAAIHGRRGGFLRERLGPLHPSPES